MVHIQGLLHFNTSSYLNVGKAVYAAIGRMWTGRLSSDLDGASIFDDGGPPHKSTSMYIKSFSVLTYSHDHTNTAHSARVRNNNKNDFLWPSLVICTHNSSTAHYIYYTVYKVSLLFVVVVTKRSQSTVTFFSFYLLLKQYRRRHGDERSGNAKPPMKNGWWRIGTIRLHCRCRLFVFPYHKMNYYRKKCIKRRIRKYKMSYI